jgi:hypothetical protein
MVVIGTLKLVLDHRDPARVVLGNEINAERPCGVLALGVAEIHVEHVVQNVDVLLKPSREVVRLMRPDTAQRHPLDLSILGESPITGGAASGAVAVSSPSDAWPSSTTKRAYAASRGVARPRDPVQAAGP